MDSKSRRDWFDMSSDISSLGSSFGSRPRPPPVQPGSGAVADVQAAVANLSIDEQQPSGPPHLNVPDHIAKAHTATGQAHESDEANTLFYQSPPTASAPDPPASPRKLPRQYGLIDASNSTHPNGLADIQVRPPQWRDRNHKPLGIRLPSQLIQFGKFNLRYEAWRDLPPDEAFNPYFPDSQQSLPANHYVNHDDTPTDFPSPDDRSPRPPLPATVMQNLQLRTRTMVNAYAAAEQKRETLLRREADLDAQASELRARLERLDRQLAALRASGVAGKTVPVQEPPLGKQTATAA